MTAPTTGDAIRRRLASFPNRHGGRSIDIVRTVTFHAPVVDRERHSDALTLWISEYQPAWLPEKEPF